MLSYIRNDKKEIGGNTLSRPLQLKPKTKA